MLVHVSGQVLDVLYVLKKYVFIVTLLTSNTMLNVYRLLH